MYLCHFISPTLELKLPNVKFPKFDNPKSKVSETERHNSESNDFGLKCKLQAKHIYLPT